MRSITIIGAGIGGLAAAAALHQRGIAVAVYEQADKFARVGAGIQQSPNAVRVLRGLGIEDRLRQGDWEEHLGASASLFLEQFYTFTGIDPTTGAPTGAALRRRDRPRPESWGADPRFEQINKEIENLKRGMQEKK